MDLHKTILLVFTVAGLFSFALGPLGNSFSQGEQTPARNNGSNVFTSNQNATITGGQASQQQTNPQSDNQTHSPIDMLKNLFQSPSGNK
jgi:hypothetical protein